MGLEFFSEFIHLIQNGCPFSIALIDRHHHYLYRSQPRRENESIVISMGHDKGAHKTCGHAPGCSPDILLLPFPCSILYIKRLRKILSEEMRCPGLKGLPVLHQSLYTQGIKRPRKPLVRALMADNDREGKGVPGKISVHVDHLHCLCLRFLAGSMSSMAFLPEELSGPQEKPCAHFPSHHICPLVAKYREVSPRCNPVLVCIPYDSLGCRPYDEFFLKPCGRVHHYARAVRIGHQPVMRHHRALLREPLYMLGLPAQERLGDKKREIGIDMPRLLEHPVKHIMHLLPDGITIRLDDHTAPYSRALSEICLHHKIVIPLRIILRPLCNLFSHCIFVFI